MSPEAVVSADRAPATARITPALKLARRGWRLLHADAPQARQLAERAHAAALASADRAGEAWALTVRGFHGLYFAPADAARVDLTHARSLFERLGDRAGALLAAAGEGRALWRAGRVDEALSLLQGLRDEGLRVLRHEQRGVLLNAIAGCHSTQGRSEEAFAYMYEALREAGPARGMGFDAVLYCNLSHEMLQLGDCDEALEFVQRGLDRMAAMRNARLESVLRVNRAIALTELGRAAEAIDDVRAVAAMPVTPEGRGVQSLSFESLSIAASRAGHADEAAQLLARAQALAGTLLPDERAELAVAAALVQHRQGRTHEALATLAAAAPLVAEPGDPAGASLRTCALLEHTACELHEAVGDSRRALAALRRWQAIQLMRMRLASRARFQAAALRTELLTLQHQLEANDIKRRATERARAEMVLANQALSRKIEEVQALQAALREQATQDALTGLFNRRHLNDTLPALLALAVREQQPLAVVVIDLDHFKAVNDEHGHPAGDLLLAAFGRLLKEGLRGSDQAFRYGGEEFCLLMPHTPADAAAEKAERLLRQWQDQVFELDGGRLAHRSFSAGVTDTRITPPAPAPLLHAADDALLAAKRAGRARVLVAQVAAGRPAGR